MRQNPGKSLFTNMSITRIAGARLPTPWAEFDIVVFQDGTDGREHLALTLGRWTPETAVLTRMHSECLTGDGLFSLRCDCGAQLEAALKAIADHGAGVLVYLRQEGRGIGLVNKIRAYALQDKGADTVEANEQLGFPADARHYDDAVAIYRELGVSRVRLMTNNPRKLEAIEKAGIEVVERVPIEPGRNHHNTHYLSTKARKLGHRLAGADAAELD